MADDRKRYNIVRFLETDSFGLATGVSVTLQLEQPYVRRFGMKPDNVTALLTFAEAQKLRRAGEGGGVVGPIDFIRRGALQFFGAIDPAVSPDGPDVQFEKMRIIDANIVDVGVVEGTGGKPISWRIVLSDLRNDWIEPRGGRLKWGLLNSSVKKPVTSTIAPTADPLFANSSLIQFCLEAMGATYQIHNAAKINGVKPAMDLKWFGSHAPTELGKLLEITQSTVVINIDGSVHVWPLGDGNGPEVSADRLILSANYNCDARPKAIVFTSAPTTKKKTFIMEGPNPDTFEYVVKDNVDPANPKSPQAWFNLDAWPRRTSIGVPADLVNHHFKNFERFSAELYWSIRLSQNVVDPEQGPILLKCYEPDGSTHDLTVIAPKVAVGAPGGTFTNEPGLPIKVHQLIAGKGTSGNILTLERRLGQLKNDTAVDADADFKEVDSFVVNFSIEDLIKRSDAGGTRWERQYLTLGFIPNGDLLQMLSQEDAESLISSPAGAVVYSMPHWNVVTKNNLGTVTDPDITDYVGEAAQRARRFFDEIKKGSFVTVAESFFAFDLNGFVGEATFDQAAGTSTFKGNTFFLPASGLVKFKPDGASASFPGESTQQSARLSDGVSGATSTGVMLNPRQAATVPFRVVFVRVTSSANGGYIGKIQTGTMNNQGGGGNPNLPDGLTDGQSVFILYAAENQLPTHRIANGCYFPCLLIDGKSVEGLQLAVVAGPPAFNLDNPVELGSETIGNETPDETSWGRDRVTSGAQKGNCPVKIWFMGDVVYNFAGEKKIIKQKFALTFDADGKLAFATAQRRGDVETPQLGCV